MLTNDVVSFEQPGPGFKSEARNHLVLKMLLLNTEEFTTAPRLEEFYQLLVFSPGLGHIFL